jgi:hypothetical protein
MTSVAMANEEKSGRGSRDGREEGNGLETDIDRSDPKELDFVVKGA